MSDLEKQKKLTDGKGWKGIDFSREQPYKAVKDAVKTAEGLGKLTKTLKKQKDIIDKPSKTKHYYAPKDF